MIGGVTSPTWGPPAPCKQALSIISIVVYSEWTKIALRAVTIYRPETYTNIREFLTFVWLLSWKCHVCLSFVIKMRKMTKLRKKLQSSYSDVIRALGYCWPRISCVFTHVASIHANLLEQKKSSYITKEFNSHRTGLEHKYGCDDVMWKHTIDIF